jgi:hypothetical protein
MEDFLKIVGIIIIVVFLVWLVFKSLKLQLGFMNKIQEGLTSSSSSVDKTNSTNGYAGNASSLAASIKALSTALTDKLIVSKYRTDYENVIINLEDYINLLMVDNVLSLNVGSNNEDMIKTINVLGSLNSSKLALNDVMKFIDGLK